MEGTVRFELREEKVQKSGKAPIGIIYSVKGQRKRFSTGQVIYPFNWDATKQRGIYLPKKDIKKVAPDLANDLILTDIEIKEINNELDAIGLRIDKIERGYVKDGVVFSSEMVVTQLKGISPEVVKAEEANRYMFNFIDRYLNENSATRSKGSLSVYRQLKVHLEAFEKHRKKRIVFADIDAQFFEAFQNYLIQHRGIANTTMQKQLRTLKTFLGYAKKNKIVIDESYKDFKVKRDSLDVFALTKQEFDALYELDLSDNHRLDKIRDVFCFACATGLRYSDFSNLKKENITESEIVFTHVKTRDYHRVPLNKYSQSILSKYAANHQLLPVISQANMNLYVKELGKKAGITQPHEKVRYKGANRVSKVKPRYEFITNHVARKTFITLSLELGMNAEEVMALSNHRDYRSFKRYVDITDQRKKLVMNKAWGAPEI
jgi:integrase